MKVVGAVEGEVMEVEMAMEMARREMAMEMRPRERAGLP